MRDLTVEVLKAGSYNAALIVKGDNPGQRTMINTAINVEGALRWDSGRVTT
jgi:hypothetical protein